MAPDSVETWNDNLEGKAINIASSENSTLHIAAGPGTGKTTSMVRRVAWLIQKKNVEPSNILACTFTRTAAKDLRSDLDELDILAVNEVRAGTLHSFCYSILNKEHVLEITGRVPRTLLNFEKRFLKEDLKDHFGGVKECEKLIKDFNAAWSKLTSEKKGWPPDEVKQKFKKEIDDWLEFHKAMLIGEVIPITLRYLRDNPASRFRGFCDYILVDEYQDLTRAEQVLLEYIAEDSSVMIVGDENQAIYKFRNGNPEGLTNYPEDRDGVHSEDLNVCRRCPEKIIQLANELIENNDSYVDRELESLPSTSEGEVKICQWKSIDQEVSGISRFIERKVSSGEVDPGRVLVLSPRRQFGYRVRDKLNEFGVAAHSFFQEEELDSVEAKKAFTLLNLLKDPTDRVSLRCWCGFDSPSRLSSAWGRLRDYCFDNSEEPRMVLEKLVSGEIEIPYTSYLEEPYMELKQKLVELDGLQGHELVDRLFPSGESWSEPFRDYTETIEGENFPPVKLYKKLKRNITQPELPNEVDYVRVMSLHKSKGLSADLVIVLGCIQGLIPHLDPDLEGQQLQKELEEQRRLFYVALTRTTETLVLSSITSLPYELATKIRAKIEWTNGSTVRTITSQFIDELGPETPEPVMGNELLS